MQLTILGNAPVPGPDGAGNGYLVETDSTAVLLDCGPGVVGKLRAHRSLSSLTGIIVSHTHLDHIYDLPILFLTRFMEQRMSGHGESVSADAAALRVYMPPAGIETLHKVLTGFGINPSGAVEGEGTNMMSGIVLTEYDPHATLAVGDLSITFIGPTKHFPGDCYAMRLTDATGALLAFSGDTSPDPMIVQMAQDTDCFLCEATMIAQDDIAGQEARHMTARAAGIYATEGHSRFLLLTHLLNQTPEWRARMEQAARETFAGPLAVAQVGQTYAVTAGKTTPA